MGHANGLLFYLGLTIRARRKFSIFVLVALAHVPLYAAADTSSVSYEVDIGLAAQFNNDKLIKRKLDNYFFGHIDLHQNLILLNKYWSKKISVRTDVSVKYFTDSIFEKDHDRWVIDLVYATKGINTVKSSFSLKYSTAMFSKFIDRDGSRYFVEGIGNPAQFELGYGIQFPIFSFSTFTFNLSNFMLRTMPREGHLLKSDQNVFRLKSSLLHASIGLKSQINLQKVVLEKIKWKHRSEVSMDRFDHSHIYVEIENDVGINIYKVLKLKLATEVILDPMISRKYQWRNRMMIGVDLSK